MKKIIFIVGPTASGKSEFAVALARKIQAEIISCDSMQVYRSMDIGTSKPGAALRGKIPHHLINIIGPSQEYSAARFASDAKAKIDEIHSKGKIPVCVGGTGLYIRALVDGLFPAPSADWKLRKRLYKLAGGYGSAYLHNRLKRKDPAAAAEIHPNDTRKLVRAIELIEKTGKNISELRKDTLGIAADYDIEFIGLALPRKKLYEKIEDRVDAMFRRGFLAEAKRLRRMKLSRTARQALGYRELFAYLDGECPLDEARRLIKRNTRHYAKRQMTWFRRDERIKWKKRF